MAVLALDTSAAVAVALVGPDGSRLAARTSAERRRHAESLAPLVAAVLDDAGLDRTALTAVAVGTGPAPFTGLRVGLVTARTLALSLGIDVLGVPSVDALAVQAVADLGLDPGDEVLVATDARRKEVYWARYVVVAHEGPQGVPVVRTQAGPDVAKAADVAQAELGTRPGSPHDRAPAGGRLVVVGEGAQLYADVLPLQDDAPLVPDATVLARVALARHAAGEDLPTEPLYLRRPDVQVPMSTSRLVPATGRPA